MAKVFCDRETVNDESVIIRKVYHNNGDAVGAGDLVLEYETSKTIAESRASEDGILSIFVSEGSEVDIGAPLYEIATQSEIAAVKEDRGCTEEGLSLKDSTVAERASRVRLSHKAQALATLLKMDVADIAVDGWITSADIAAIAGGAAIPQERTTTTAAAGHGGEKGRDVVTEATSNTAVPFEARKTSMRKRTELRTLKQADASGVMSTIGVSVRVSGERLVMPPALFADSISDIVIFEAGRLAKIYPEANAFYLDEKNNGYFKEVNVGISFDSGENLKVLALRNADKKTLGQIQDEFIRLLDIYESGGPIDPDILNTATVTISDLSATRATFMLPLINGQQSVILGITRTSAGFDIYASFDHRVSDGLQISRYLGDLAKRVSDHFRIGRRSTNMQCCVCERDITEELSLGHRGMIKIALPDGAEGLLCRNCFEGY